MDPVTIPEETLRALALRRAEMMESIVAVERALAAPAASGSPQWAQRVHVALVELSADLREHVGVTEAPDGLHAEIVGAVPRLAHAASQLSADHSELRAMLDEAIECAAAPGPSDQVRELGTALLGRLFRHRQRGSDLVFEAFETDLGGET